MLSTAAVDKKRPGARFIDQLRKFSNNLFGWRLLVNDGEVNVPEAGAFGFDLFIGARFVTQIDYGLNTKGLERFELSLSRPGTGSTEKALVHLAEILDLNIRKVLAGRGL